MKKFLIPAMAAAGALIALLTGSQTEKPQEPSPPAPPVDPAPVYIPDDDADKEARRARMRELGRKGGKKRVENARKKKEVPFTPESAAKAPDYHG